MQRNTKTAQNIRSDQSTTRKSTHSTQHTAHSRTYERCSVQKRRSACVRGFSEFDDTNAFAIFVCERTFRDLKHRISQYHTKLVRDRREGLRRRLTGPQHSKSSFRCCSLRSADKFVTRIHSDGSRDMMGTLHTIYIHDNNDQHNAYHPTQS